MSLCTRAAFFFRFLHWLAEMGRAFMQARRWLRAGFGLFALRCWRDAWHAARLAGDALRMWRFCLWLVPPVLV